MLLTMDITHVSGAGETHRGGRSSNQDVLVIEPDLGLYAVLDGMGGHAGGEVAARIASETLVHFIRRHSASERFTPHELLESAIDIAAAVVHLAGKHQTECRGMGTTVAACLVVDRTCAVIGHAGDSRAYLSRDGGLQLLTYDHTIAQRMIDAGKLTPADAELTQYKHILTRNLGEEQGVQAEFVRIPLQVGDRLLLCTDGLYGCVAQETIQTILASRDVPQATARALVDLALNSDHVSDNVSAVVVEVAGP